MKQWRTMLIGVGALVALARPAGAVEISTAPYVINAPGYYQVTADLSLAVGTVIEIKSGGVRLNLNGHTLTGSPTASRGIYVHDVTGVTVSGGKVTLFDTCVEARNVQSVLLQDLDLGPAWAGVLEVGSRAVTIQGCTAQGCVGFGFLLSGGTANAVRGCMAGSNRYGLRASEGERSLTLTNTTATYNGEGFLLQDLRAGVVVGNRATNNGGAGNMDGFEVVRGGGNRFVGNVASDNWRGGFELLDTSNNWLETNQTDRDAIGILLDAGATANTVVNNRAMGNRFNGIGVATGATRNTIMANRALTNGAQDLSDGNVDCDSNRWSNNIFATRNLTCIH